MTNGRDKKDSNQSLTVSLLPNDSLARNDDKRNNTEQTFFDDAIWFLNNRKYPELAAFLGAKNPEEFKKPKNQRKNAYQKYFEENRYKENKKELERIKREKSELLNLFRSQHKKQDIAFNFLSWLGIASEVFYLYWDFRGREEVTRFYIPSADNEAFANLSWNRLINILVTLPVGVANIVYWPPKAAQDFMENAMLGKSLLKDINRNIPLSVCFLLYSLGGSYIEAEQFYKKWPLEIFVPFALAILIAGTSYYTVFNYKDTVTGFKDFREGKGYPRNREQGYAEFDIKEECLARGLSYFHKLLVTIERSVRIGYGGYSALAKMSGSLTAGYSVASLIGLGTVPVALGTRAMSTHALYYPNPKDVKLRDFYEVYYTKVKRNYDKELASSRILGELWLAASPSVFLQLPLAYFVGQLAGALFSEGSIGQTVSRIVTSGLTLFASHRLFRCQAKRKELMKLTIKRLKDEKEEREKKQENKQENKQQENKQQENKQEAKLQMENSSIAQDKSLTKSTIISYVSNGFDQLSRTLTMLYLLNQMAPSIFNTDTFEGQQSMILVGLAELYIATAAYVYQSEKCIEAYEGIGAALSETCLFKKKSSSANNCTDEEDGKKDNDYLPPPRVASTVLSINNL